MIRHLQGLGTTGPTNPIDPELTRPAVGAWLVLIVTVAVALRALLFVLGPALEMERAAVDPSALALSHHMVESGRFARSFEDGHGPATLAAVNLIRGQVGQLEPYDAHGLRPETHDVPMYAALLAAVEIAALPQHVILGLQALLAAGTVLLVYGLARRLFDAPMPAMLAAVLVAVHPVFIMAPNLLLPVSLATFLLAAGLYLTAPKPTRTAWGSTFGGLAFGAAALAAPFAVLAGPVMAVWMLLTSPRGRTLLAAGLMLIASLVPPAVWMLRNHQAGLGFRLAGAPTIEAYFGAAAEVRQRLAEPPITPAEAVNLQLASLQEQASVDHDVYALMEHDAARTLIDHPQQTAEVLAARAAALFTGASTDWMYAVFGLTYEPTDPLRSVLTGDLTLSQQTDRAGAWLTLGQRMINTALAIVSLVALVILAWRRRFGALLLLAGALAYLVLASLVTPTDLLRLPVIAIQAVLIASLLTDPPPRRAPKPKKPRKKRIARSFDKSTDEDPPETAPAPTGRPI